MSAVPRRAARSGLVLAGHVAAVFLQSALAANVVWLMPLLVRLRFGADDPLWRDWQTTLVTAAVPAFLMLSIFWNELLGRVRLRTYLLVTWLMAALPLGCVGLVSTYWQLLACHVIAMAGAASWAPLSGKLLKSFYSDAIRGRAYAILNTAVLAGSLTAVYLVGGWLERDPEAFRVFFPIGAAVQVAGFGLLLGLARWTAMPDQPAAATRHSWASVLRPITSMREVLRADRTFLRYETAFMTYGAAFMLCDALLPVLGTDKFHMRYEDYAHSTHVVMRLVMLTAMLPMGWLIDRLGAVRTSCLAFAVLTGYPLLLLAADGKLGVGLASAVYGLGLAGVQMGWMLGPVSLAGSPEKVPQYVAIHATLVGVRGLLFQGLGMLVYKLTGSFLWPLLLAATAFLWAALQMRQLHGLIRRRDDRGGAGVAPDVSGTAVRLDVD